MYLVHDRDSIKRVRWYRPHREAARHEHPRIVHSVSGRPMREMLGRFVVHWADHMLLQLGTQQSPAAGNEKGEAQGMESYCGVANFAVNVVHSSLRRGLLMSAWVCGKPCRLR